MLAETAEQLRSWAATEAFALWGTRGIDAAGTFEEKLDDEHRPVGLQRRARVQPRQVFSFAHARQFGWDGPAERIMRDGFEGFVARYRREDGLFRTLADADGRPLDEQALLYDQAFVLLALAAGRAVLESAEERAVALRAAIERDWGHASGGFLSGDRAPLPLLANPHMHLLEACLAWVAAGGDPGWRTIADRIAGLALARMIEPATGALHESFDAQWRRSPGLAGRVVEPGHQFEWAWLLMRWAGLGGGDAAREAAFALIGSGERGVDPQRGVAVLETLDDGTVHAPVGRLWAQTERVKAGCLAWSLTGEERFVEAALAGCRSVQAFIAAAPSGLWRDQLPAEGGFVVEPTPASTFYHLVVAIDVLGETTRRAVPA